MIGLAAWALLNEARFARAIVFDIVPASCVFSHVRWLRSQIFDEIFCLMWPDRGTFPDLRSPLAGRDKFISAVLRGDVNAVDPREELPLTANAWSESGGDFAKLAKERDDAISKLAEVKTAWEAAWNLALDGNPENAVAKLGSIGPLLIVDKTKRLEAALALLHDPERMGRLRHESWCETRRAQGGHGPKDPCNRVVDEEGGMDMHPPRLCNPFERCTYYHADLIPWTDLPKWKKTADRDAVLLEIERILSGAA